MSYSKPTASTKAARAYLASLVAQLDDAVILESLDGTVLSWSAGAENLFGYSASEMVGYPSAALCGPDKVPELAALQAELLRGRAITRFETKRVRKDGVSVDVSVCMSPIRDDRGSLIALSVIARGITEQLRRLEQSPLTRELQESENRLKQFIDQAPGCIAMFDTEMRYLIASRWWCQQFSVNRSEIIGRSQYEVFPEITPAWKDIHRRAMAGETLHNDGEPFIRADGSTQWVKWEVAPWLTISGAVGGIVIIAEEFTQRRQEEQQLEAQHALMRVTLESIGDAVITTDQNGKVQWLNPVASRLTGWGLSEARNKPIGEVFRIVHEGTRHPVICPTALALEEGHIVSLPDETVLIARDGTEHGIQDSAAPIRNHTGEILGTVLVFHDVTEQRRLAQEVTHRASHDSLTGLVNRFEFEARLHLAFEGARQEGHVHALMYIDLDQFKLVNDACGHAAGDRLLREVASLFQGVVRTRDTLARLGGDEFGLLLEECTAYQARRVAELLCDRLENFRFVHDDRRFRVGASIGIVPLDDRWSTEAEVLQAADTACYAAKEAGRNRIHEWFDTDTIVKARHGEMQWVTRLESALDEHRFRLYAQRIERCRGETRRLHFEVLLRLCEVDGNIVSPSIFFSAAERFNMASRIDRWVIRAVLDWMTSQDFERIGTVAVNLSGQSIGDRSFHRYAVEHVSRTTRPDRLCFEITETAAITHMEDAKEFITAMRKLGVRIALDDFGAGASSFGYLKLLPADLLKVDGQFVRDILHDRLDHTAVCCFHDIAAACNLQTVAECVETEDVLAELRRIGVDFAQGYLLHRPEPLEVLVSKFAQSRCNEVREKLEPQL
jgi:diguanylate cyclase (GGDEF)-like protein/PAS domain S-box-containing protein